MDEALLAIDGATKRFGGLVAVNDVSLAVRRGEIFAVIGPNGAGKTTFFNLVAGVYRPTAGRINFADRPIERLRPHEVAGLGIGRTFQNVRLLGNMSVIENVMVGRHARTKVGFFEAALRLPRASREEAAIRAAASAQLAFVGLAERADDPAPALPFGQQRLLAMARTLATEPRLLLLDEPGAGLNATEKAHLAGLVRRLRDGGLTILLVEHDMDLVAGLADRVAVLDHGEKIAEGTMAEARRDPKVVEAYLGSKRS